MFLALSLEQVAYLTSLGLPGTNIGGSVIPQTVATSIAVSLILTGFSSGPIFTTSCEILSSSASFSKQLMQSPTYEKHLCCSPSPYMYEGSPCRFLLAIILKTFLYGSSYRCLGPIML